MLTRLLLCAALLGLSACAIHVSENGHRSDIESCSIECPRGGSADVTCEKPKIPACSCEPAPAAACVKAEAGSILRL